MLRKWLALPNTLHSNEASFPHIEANLFLEHRYQNVGLTVCLLHTQAAARRHSKEAGAGRSLLAANIAEPAAVDRTRKRSSDSAVALAAAAASDNAAAAEPQKEETVVKPKKVKEVCLCWARGVMFDCGLLMLLPTTAY